MALIEGVGDEVTLLFGSLLVLLVLLLAWISTHTSEPPEPLFNASTDPTPTEGTVSAQQDTPLSSTSSSSLSFSPTSSSSSAASSVNDSVPSEAQPTTSATQEERTAQVKPQDTIGYIKRTYFAGQEQQVRLIYQGQLLQDDAQTLASLNLAHNCVLHCHISQHAARGAAGGVRPGDQVQVALNVGSLMVPLLVLMLSVLWYCQIQYRQFFTAPATASLVGVTIFFSLVAFGVYRR
uniref:Transmembrane and ubiquitin-like domain-containing protein 1 n=1 Tax=Oryzias latipes TaxID=8090 RepID=A0A3P9L9H7_ORYLA